MRRAHATPFVVAILAWAVLGVAVGGGTGCGKGPATAASPPDVDRDALGLVPAGPHVIARIDARAISDHPATSSAISLLAHALLPLGEDTGVDAGRDIDSMIVAQYGSTASTDIVVVASGRFDPVRIASSTHGAGGASVSVTRYAGLPLSTLTSVSYSALSARTLIAGTNEGVHRVLERVQAGHLDRVVAPWIADTVATPGTPVAIAADFETEPLNIPSVPAIDLSWLEGVRVARLFATFEPPGMHFGATLGYATSAQAAAAASGARTLARWIQVFGPLVGGLTLQAFESRAEQTDVHCSFVVDDATLRAALALLGRAMARR